LIVLVNYQRVSNHFMDFWSARSPKRIRVVEAKLSSNQTIAIGNQVIHLSHSHVTQYIYIYSSWIRSATQLNYPLAPFAIKHAEWVFSPETSMKIWRDSSGFNIGGFASWNSTWKLHYWQVPFSRRATTLSFYTMIGWCHGSFTPYTYSAAFDLGLVTSVNASRLRSDFPLNRHISYQKISAHILVTEKEYHIRKSAHILVTVMLLTYIPSGNLTVCYGKNHHFSWENPL